MNIRVTITNKEELRSMLIADLDKYVDSFLRAGIRNAQPIMEELAKEAIANFYNSFRSIYYYDRTGNLQNNSYSSICESTGSGMFVGVKISGEGMGGYASGVDPGKIVGWAWGKGAHGYPGYLGTQFTFPPISMLQMAVGDVGKQILREATDNARNQNYRVLRF